MGNTQFWVALLVPTLVKKMSPVLKRLFKLNEIDEQTARLVKAKKYPFYYDALYMAWGLIFISTGIIAMLLIMVYGSVWLPNLEFSRIIGLAFINMFGAWCMLGALVDIVFWFLATDNFKHYLQFKIIESGWGYDIKQQIIVIIKIGVIYYLIMSPLIIWLLSG